MHALPNAPFSRLASGRCIARCGALCIALALHGCATVPRGSADDDAQNDPIEPLNRGVFAFNMALDRAAIKPIAKAYRAVLPVFVRERVRAVIDNLQEPLVFANDVLQGRGEAAAISGRRFLVNTTVGLAGLFDRASEFGLAKQSGDFGQTLYAWGVGDGPYLVLPFFGPSNVRDAVGLSVDMVASPAGHVGSHETRREVGIAVGATDGIDLRSRNIESLDAIEASSLDFYAYLRSIWRQNRLATLRDARAGSPEEELIDPGATTPGPDAAKPERSTPPSR